MVSRKGQAWVTSVLTENSIFSALVLAKSLRSCKTDRQIVVIGSKTLSNDTQHVLQRSFDSVFWIDDNTFGRKVNHQHDFDAKLYTIALNIFEKCIFISADSLVMENVDWLFENEYKFVCHPNPDPTTSLADLKLLVVEPDIQLWNFFLVTFKNNTKEMSEAYFANWLKEQKVPNSILNRLDHEVAKFSLSDGLIHCKMAYAPIITFLRNNRNISMFDDIKMLEHQQLGLLETKICETWTNMYFETQVSKVQQNQWIFRGDMIASYKHEPIAIVGMSCRFPGANTLAEFWKMIYEGDEGIREPPAFRWTKEHTLRVTQQDRKSQAGFLASKVDEFDSRFFGVSPKEAAFMDPQARILHEVLWESLEDAGINPQELCGTHAGIFTGSWMNDYKDIVTHSVEKDFFRTYMGNSIGASAARLSHLLGITGPCIATESGCSSAIVAVDRAVESLRAGETSLAMAAGVNLILHPFNSAIMEYVISPDGRCKTFDANADGFGRAEGCGVLVLKRLGDALHHRDKIWAVIRGSAVSQEGLSRSLGTPTVHCEALAMKLALKDANVTPERVSFVETHGTGTQVGDPLEVSAIAKAYHSNSRKDPLVIGSVKTNVGHTESCSGITGIMKAVLAMHHEIIPKHRNLETLNPEIFLDSIPAIIPTENRAWPKVHGQPRICGVSSFGITGTNGHVILEEAPENDMPKFTMGMERTTHLITISAKTSEALDELLKEHENRLSGQQEDKELADVAYTANVGRAAFNHRAFVVASNVKEAAKIMKEGKCVQGEVKDGHQPQLCMLFTGQGSQYQGMARSLYETSPIFRVSFDNCERELRTLYGVSIKKILWDAEASSKELSRTIYSQTSIFCVEYCLLRLWQSWGIQPDYVLGHSLGEFCAAVAAGVLDFEDALKLVAERSRLIDNLPRGSMLVVKAGKPEVAKLMKNAKIDLDFAAVNNAEQTVVAGDIKTVEELLAYVKSQDVKAVVLEATHAFHSRHMDPMLEEYRKVAQTIKFKRGHPNIQYVSGMEGRVLEDTSEFGADYWVRHTREMVSFIDACTALKDSGCTDFLEVGPQPVLSTFVMMNNEGVTLNCLPSLRRGQDDWAILLSTLGKLYLLGYSIDWKGYDEPYIRQKVSLPFHPFHRKPLWVESPPDNATMIHPLVGGAFKNASALHIFQNDLTLKAVPYLKDHCIGSHVIFPGAGYTEMCLSAGYCVAYGITDTFEQPSRPMRLENLRVQAPLELKEGKSCRLQVIVDLPEKTEKQEEEASSGFRVKVFHQNANNSEESSGKWMLHASSTFLPMASTLDCLKRWDAARIQEIIGSSKPVPTESFYQKMDDQGLKFGENFRSIRRFWTKKQENCNEDTDEVVAEIALPSDWNKYLLHPLVMDAMLQAGILTRCHYESPKLKVPVRIGELTLFSGVNAKQGENDIFYMHVRTENGIRRLFLCTAGFTPICYVKDVELIDTNVRTIESVLEQQNNGMPDAWEETWKVISTPFQSSAETPIDMDQIEPKPYIPQAGADVQYEQVTRLLYLYIVDALLELGWSPAVGSTLSADSLLRELGIRESFRHLIRFYLQEIGKEGEILSWDKALNCWRVKAEPTPRQVAQGESQSLAVELKRTPLFSSLLVYEHLAESLPKILRGEVSALQLLFPVDIDQQQYSAESFYQNHPSREGGAQVVMAQAKQMLRQTWDKNGQDPSKMCRVLEVGAGTGVMSIRLAELTREVWGSRVEYYFTDISPSFFLKAEKRLEDYREVVKFVVFNIEESPLSQGIPLEYFDFVCGTDVLHATRNLEETLIHLRQILKPGGVLMFTETIVPARDITFVYGLLEGYWRMEDKQRRPEHCCVSDRVWEDVLCTTGFGKVHAEKMYLGQFACITAVADERCCPVTGLLSPTRRRGSRPAWLVLSDVGDVDLICGPVANTLHASGFRVTVQLLRQEEEEEVTDCETQVREGVSVRHVWAHDLEEGVTRALEGETGSPIQGIIYGWGLRRLREEDQKKVALPFLHVAKALVSKSQPPQLFVLTQGVHSVTEELTTENPSAATLFGMAKSLKNELSSMFVRLVDLEARTSAAQWVAQVLYEVAMSKTAKEAQRLQVAYRAGARYEPRLRKAVLPKASDALKVPPSTDRYKLKLSETRVIPDLEFEAEEECGLEEQEVEVKVHAYALNFRDIFTILKPSAEFETLNAVGLDFSGVVTRAGAASRWKVGERVFGVNFKDGLLPSILTIDSGVCIRVPNHMTHWEASSLPAVFLTAYHGLITIAKMRKEDTVLIHTASGGVGLAAIQLAQNMGVNLITTAGNPRKRAYLRGRGVKHVFHSRDTSYEQDILRVTQGRGVDVVLNSITGPGVKEATLRATAKNGRFVEMSKLNTWTVEEVKTLRPDVDYNVIDLTQLELETTKGLVHRMQRYLEEGSLKPIPYVRFDALHLRQALQYLQKAKHIGKVVVIMPEVKTEAGLFITKSPMFNPESTYLITGGLGGIGFEVCKWMLGLGATDIVLTGRNPPKPEIVEQISKLNNNKNGTNVTVRLGDVGDFAHCQDIIREIRKNMKPLRGIMHCAGVLRDNLYANQSWSDFEATYRPKVQGTWNLHQLTKSCPLEHFVVYSSLTALVGTPGQPNHCSANCFEDAFIHYRHSFGLPGTTINWGQWAQVGCATEVNLPGLIPVSFQRMLNGMEIALKTQKRQVCFSEFESFSNFSILIPSLRSYMDERLWKQFSNSSSATGHASVKADQFWKDMDVVETQSEKVGVLSGYLKTILRAALRLEEDEPIEDDANLQELGVDSLMTIELKNSIQTLLGSRLTITANLLKNCNTVRLLANAVISKLMENSEEEKPVPEEPLPYAELLELLQKDACLEVSIKPSFGCLKASEIKTVLVTGVTGQVAPYLIAELEKSYPSVEKIWCLVRGSDNALCQEKLKAALADIALDLEKVEAVSGDVTQEKMGISTDKYEELIHSVDAVIHCAAKTHSTEHMRTPNAKLSDISSINIGGTTNVLKFASVGKVKKVFYPSTLLCGAMGANSEQQLADSWPEISVIDTIVNQKFPGLQTSKWICEILLKQANERGIPCKVFRLPWIGGDSKTGRVDTLKNLYILRYLSFLRMGAMPDVAIPANVLPVDLLAELSLQMFMNDKAPNEIFNLAHPHPEVEQAFVPLAEKEFGKTVEILDPQSR